jgi:hypothetical protein
VFIRTFLVRGKIGGDDSVLWKIRVCVFAVGDSELERETTVE